MTRDEVEQAFAAAARVHWAQYMTATQAGDPLTAELERARFNGLWSAAEAMRSAASVAAILTYPDPRRGEPELVIHEAGVVDDLGPDPYEFAPMREPSLVDQWRGVDPGAPTDCIGEGVE